MFKFANSAPSSRARHFGGIALSIGIALGVGTFARQADASPAVEGTRNLSLGSVSRSSSFGSNAALINPSNMVFSPVFTVEALYQYNLQSKTHGLGFVVMDSLNNSRVSIGLGYLFMRGAPNVSYIDSDTTERRDFELSRFGHEAFLAINIAIVRQWLALGLKPKYQYTSLRYRDSVGVARNAHKKLNAFGLDTALTANFAGWAALSLIGTNVVGNHSPYFTDDSNVSLEGLPVQEGSIQHESLPEVSDYPLGFAHGASVFPLRSPVLSINFDGAYDFSTFKFEKHTRVTLGGSAEFIAGPVPLRFGTIWDGRGKGSGDDRIYVAGGIAYVKPAKIGGVGVDLGFGFQQQVDGPLKETILGFNLGMRLHPDL